MGSHAARWERGGGTSRLSGRWPMALRRPSTWLRPGRRPPTPGRCAGRDGGRKDRAVAPFALLVRSQRERSTPRRLGHGLLPAARLTSTAKPTERPGTPCHGSAPHARRGLQEEAGVEQVDQREVAGETDQRHPGRPVAGERDARAPWAGSSLRRTAPRRRPAPPHGTHRWRTSRSVVRQRGPRRRLRRRRGRVLGHGQQFANPSQDVVGQAEFLVAASSVVRGVTCDCHGRTVCR